MLCEKCEQSPANIQLQINVDGKLEKHYLCTSCYKEEQKKLGSLPAVGSKHFGFDPFMAESFFDEAEEKKAVDKQSANNKQQIPIKHNENRLPKACLTSTVAT